MDFCLEVGVMIVVFGLIELIIKVIVGVEDVVDIGLGVGVCIEKFIRVGECFDVLNWLVV